MVRMDRLQVQVVPAWQRDRLGDGLVVVRRVLLATSSGRESLGDEGYLHAWRDIVIGGAIAGAILYYLSNLYMQRVLQRFRRPTDSLNPEH
jgi:hypothetical protein